MLASCPRNSPSTGHSVAADRAQRSMADVQDDPCPTVNQQRALDLLLRLKHEFDPRHLREACKELTSLVLKHRDCVQILEDYHGQAPVIDMMEHHTYEADVQQTGYEALAAMMSASNKLRDLIQKRNVHQDVLEIMSKHTMDIGVQTAAMKVITFLAMSANICNFLMEEQILESVVLTMTRFPNDADLQRVASQALRQLLAEDPTIQVDFVDAKRHLPIIASLRNHPDNPGVQEEGMWVLAVLAGSEENYDILLQECHKLLVTAMKNFSTEEGVLTASFALTDAMAVDIESQHLLEVNGISGHVLKGISAFPHSADIQTLGFCILAKLSDAVFRALTTQESRMDINWLPDIFLGLTLHLDSSECQEAGCTALNKLVESFPQVLTGCDERISIDNAVLASLRVHGNTDVGVFIASCTSINFLVINSEDMRESFMEKGTHMDIQQGMKTHMLSDRAQAIACRALMGLCLFSPKDKQILAQDGVHEEIFRALKNYLDKVEVLEAAIGAIACLADVNIVRYQCMVEGIHELILGSMVSYPDNSRIQELSLEAMAVLSTADGMAEILCEAGTLAYTVETMARYSHCEGIQQKGSILLQALVAEQKSVHSLPVARQVAKALVAAMAKFRHDPLVLAECCVAMQLLAETSEQIGQVFVENMAHSELFYIIETYSADEVLIDLACECLYVLCRKWDFKKDMLLWACRQNKLKGVEVLLQLDADVNIGKEGETPLCLAVQQGNTDMVRVLLRQGVSDIQMALRLAIELKHNDIIGFLLQRMGHDKEGGVVTWSGLGLTVLQPLWFYPTFVGQLRPAHKTSISMSQIANRIRHSQENRIRRRQEVLSLLSEGSSSNLAPVLHTSSRNILVSADRELYPRSPRPRKCLVEEFSEIGDGGQSASIVFQLDQPEEASVTDSVSTDPSASLSPLQGAGRDPSRLASDRRHNHERSWSLNDPEYDYHPKAWGRMRQRSVGEMDMIRKVSSSFVPWRKSLSSANLPISPDDPRCLESLQRGLREQGSARDSSANDSSSRPLSPSLLTIESYVNIRSRSHPESEIKRTLSVSQEDSMDVFMPLPIRTPSGGSRTSKVFSFTSMSDSSTTDMDGTDSFQAAGVMPDVVPALSPTSTQLHSTPNRKNRRSSRNMLRINQPLLDVPDSSDRHIHLLDLSANGITGMDCITHSLDAKLMEQFAFLEKLDLSNNALEELPQRLAQCLPKLQHLDLRNNQFQSLPVHFFDNKKLQTLDMSGNKIHSMTEKPQEVSFSLVDLNLSNNKIQKFPTWLGQYAPALVTLSLSRNYLSELPAVSIDLRRLQTLDLSHNKLSDIQPESLWDCLALDYLNFSHNQLKSLPEELSEILCCLVTLKVAENNLALPSPSYIPKMILQLPRLRSIDLSTNGLTGVPPPKDWKSQALRDIQLGYNKIKELDLSEGVRSWQKLERLGLNNNHLSQVPKEIGQISSLASLDISYNSSITSIPDELGKLARLWEFPLEGLKLNLDPSILKGRTKDIIGFLNQKLKQSVPYYRMKLMLVGFGGRGKSTLLARLQRRRRSKKEVNVATVGIKVQDWMIPVKSNKKTVDFCLNTWDFAGQEDFYSTHPCFLTGRALFLVVYDISKGEEEAKTLRPWLLTIQALAPSCPVVVVGTHKDKIPKDKELEFIRVMEEKVRTLCQSPGFPEIKGFRVVSCTSENEGLEALRKLIVELVETCKIKGQPVLGQMIPYSYQRLEELLMEEARKMKEEKKAPVLMRRQLLQIVREHSLQLDNDELSQAVRFLHETGVLLHYNDPANQLKDMYFVDPEWLCKIMALVVTVREINPFISTNGVMRISDLPILFTRTEDPPKQMMPQYLKLLEKFEIALPINENELLIPCKMPREKPSIHLPFTNRQDLLHRVYDMPYVPIGLWSRLILRLLVFSTQMLETPAPIVPNCCDDVTRDTKYWREGIYVCWSREAFFSVEPLTKDLDGLKITVPQTKDGYRLLGQLCDHVDDLIEEWFPGLTEIDPLLGRTLVQRRVPCVLCKESDVYLFLLDDLIERSEVSDFIICPNHEDMPVALKLLAPDVMLADLEDRFHIDQKQLLFSPSSSKMLGDGSFGSVYRAKYKDQAVAVKVFGLSPDCHPHRLLRQEVTILRQLQHPSLVSMEGVGLNPRVLVMELAQLGSLSSVLKNKKLTSRSVQHRIALQVAEGLMFLHEHRIVYRDLKPDNILIFSLSLGIMYNAKIADYGISKFTTAYGLRAPEGTPGYRAPEVIRGISTYNTEVDVYSFGILLYEMVTGGHKPFEELEFRSELDEAVMKGRQLPPLTQNHVAPWPDLQELIDYCVEHVSQHRPTSEEVFKWLSSAELLCLKREYPLLMDVCVECMAVRVYQSEGEECHEVWLAGGDGKTTMVSWIQPFNLNPENSIQGMMMKTGRALCMTAVGEYSMVIGTQSGELCVCDLASSPYRLKHTLPKLGDAVVCVAYWKRDQEASIVFAGLANGKLAIYKAHRLQNERDCQPDKMIHIGSRDDPIKCISLTHKKVWLAYSSKVISLSLYDLESDVNSTVLQPDQENEPAMVKCIAVEKAIWLCRRNSSIIEIWDISGCKKIMTIDVAEFISKEDAADPSNCYIKSLLLQPLMALWVGTAGGHMILIDTNTHQLVTITKRHASNVRAMVAVKGHGSNKFNSVVVTSGSGFVRRPGSREQSDTRNTHVLVWDAEFKSIVRSLKSDLDRRQLLKTQSTKSWHKVQRLVRTSHAFHLRSKVIFPHVKL